MSEPYPVTDPGKPAAPQPPPVRRYRLSYNRRWATPAPPPVPPPEPGTPEWVPEFVPVTWAGLELQVSEDHADRYRWFTAIVENVDGWYASPPLDGKNAERELSDGSVLGPKLLRAREIAIRGAAVGPRARLMQWRDLLAQRAVSRTPAELVIGDRQLGVSLLAMVRADSDSFKHTFFAGPAAFRYEVTVTAADPRLYDLQVQQVVLTTRPDADAGRPYDRLYWHPREDPAPDPLNGWRYQQPYPAGSAAYLTNAGDADAPVYATYDGDLTESRLTDEQRSILLADVGAGVRIGVNTETLTATAPGGEPRASWVLPGSRGLVIPAFTTARWHLYAQGSGTVTLTWRSAWA